MLAYRTTVIPIARRAHRSDERLHHYSLLRKLQGGLRAEVWIGLGADAATLDEAVLIKVFFPHAEGPAREGLVEELALAQRLAHENIVRSLDMGSESERPFIVHEYLEGATLQTLLMRARVARASMPPAAVARVLLALLNAVEHGERQAATVTSRGLVHQMVAVEDVFVTYDGAVKLLGFKSRLGQRAKPAGSAAGARETGAVAAICALSSAHSTPRLAAVLAAANDTSVRPCDRFSRLARALETWQAEELGSDGRSELAAFTGAVLPTQRLERSTQLEAAWADTRQARRASAPGALDLMDEPPPVSGIRLRSD